jgi:hypothetical protein
VCTVKKFLIIFLFSFALITIFYFLPYGTWASIGELPLHPLVVHGVVVLLPLITIGILIGIWKVKFFERNHLSILVVATLATLGVLVAASSGNSLSAAVGLPEKHAEWGNNLVLVAMALVIAIAIFAFFTFYRKVSFISNTFRVLLGILSIASITLTVAVGHSGAESVWKGRYAAAKVPIAFSLDRFTAEEVAAHNSTNDCWTIINGFVYEVTSFIRRHPGGSSDIEKMCGVDASEDFLKEHGGQREPSEWLETLKIGRLK